MFINPEMDCSLTHAGLYVLYPTNRTVAFVHAWARSFANSTDHDQGAMYHLMRQGPTHTAHPSNPTVRAAFNNGLWIGIVPAYIFSNGHSYTISELHKVHGLLTAIGNSHYIYGLCASQVKNATGPLAMHVTWTYGGVESKISRLREAKMWHDEHAYYYNGSYLTVDLRVPTASISGVHSIIYICYL